MEGLLTQTRNIAQRNPNPSIRPPEGVGVGVGLALPSSAAINPGDGPSVDGSHYLTCRYRLLGAKKLPLNFHFQFVKLAPKELQGRPS
jgi:hypothetical protein